MVIKEPLIDTESATEYFFRNSSKDYKDIKDIHYSLYQLCNNSIDSVTRRLHQELERLVDIKTQYLQYQISLGELTEKQALIVLLNAIKEQYAPNIKGVVVNNFLERYISRDETNFQSSVILDVNKYLYFEKAPDPGILEIEKNSTEYYRKQGQKPLGIFASPKVIIEILKQKMTKEYAMMFGICREDAIVTYGDLQQITKRLDIPNIKPLAIVVKDRS